MRKIKLTQGKYALVDDEDYEELSMYKWHTVSSHKTFYATRVTRVGWKIGRMYMHQAILGSKDGLEADHINRNGLNNQKKNLRLVTRSENCFNRGKRSDNSSGFIGVTWRKREKDWRARITFYGKRIELGQFKKKSHAIAAYRSARKELHIIKHY